MTRPSVEPVKAVTIGSLVGLLLGLVECGVSLPHVLNSPSSLAFGLLTIGTYPLAGGFTAWILSRVPVFRIPSRFLTALVFFVLTPWLVGMLFPRAPYQLLLRPVHLPKTLGIACFALLVAREAGRKAALLCRLELPKGAIVGLPLLSCGAAAVLLGWPRAVPLKQSDGRPPTGGPNVVLLTIDTLRKDEVGFFSGSRGITPSLDSLALSGATFFEATSCAPWTLSSLATIHTGHYPSTTGVFTGKNRLAPGFDTMARLLARRGYHTHAIGRNTWLKPEFGLSQGFEAYDSGPSGESSSPHRRVLFLERIVRSEQAPSGDATGDASSEASKTVADKACAFLQRSGTSKPFFLWLHFNNVHAPYEPRGDYLPPREAYNGPFMYTSGTVVRLRTGNRIDAADKTRLRELYRGEIRYVDRLIGRVLSTLREIDLATSTLVVCASDHGEEFWDHGSVMHGHTLYGELLEVPLIFSWPDRIGSGQRIHAPCSFVDIMPTVLDLLGVEHNASFPGRALLDDSSDGDRARFAEGLEFFDEQKSVTWRGWKLITSEETGKSRLFYLPEDPEESYDLFRERPDIASGLADTLASHLERCRLHADRLQLDRSASTVHLSMKLKEQLRAQGYIE